VDLVKAAVEKLGGKGGGGRPDFAQGGGKDAANAEAAIAAAEAVLKEPETCPEPTGSPMSPSPTKRPT
jgi:alanyl-tRNA synthetase